MFNLDHLAELSKEPSYRIPRGLTREERRAYIKNLALQIEQEENQFLSIVRC